MKINWTKKSEFVNGEAWTTKDGGFRFTIIKYGTKKFDLYIDGNLVTRFGSFESAEKVALTIIEESDKMIGDEQRNKI